jgi:HK97 family phage major capsid protein
LKAAITGDYRAAEAEIKALGGSGVPGSFLLPSPVSAQYIDLARARAVAVQAGVQTIVFNDGKMVIPALSADVTAAWRAENALIGESDPTFAPVNVTPKSLAAMVRVSAELLADSPELAGRMIEASLTGALATALDAAVLRGNGQNDAPTGIRFAQNVVLRVAG